jgi:heavy metal sensor kinase
MRQMSIRLRLALWYSAALTAGLGLLAFATWISMRHTLVSDADATLAEHARSLDGFVNKEIAEPSFDVREELNEFSQGFPQGTFVQVKDSHGSVVFTSNAIFPWPTSTEGDLVSRNLDWEHRPYRLLIRTLYTNGQKWQVAIAESLEPAEKILNRLRLLLILLIPAIILIAASGGLWLSRRALKPVDEITAAARSIGIANLSERLAVAQTGDELQRLSETLNGMFARLEDAVKRLSRFTADASHELRTPLAVIRTTAEITARRPRPEAEYREALTQIVSQAQHMTRLVEDLLFLARCDSESIEMPMSTINLVSVVEHVCSEIRPLADSKGIHFSCRLPRKEVTVLGNELAIRRLVLVLLDNAVKYSQASGNVSVSLRETKDELHLEITDSGPGIAEAEVPRIFERFYRAPEARNSAQTGAGLGLSLAAGIAQHHHARIEVQSLPGTGSTFRVLFQPMPVTS